MTVYLDFNATAPLRPEGVQAMTAAMEVGGNPSSVHSEGRAARKIVDQARRQVAQLVGVKADQVIFTSGGTEANNQVLRGCGRAWVVASAIEHPAVLKAHDAVEIVAVDGQGLIDLDALEASLAKCDLDGRDEDTIVSVMLANNETGVIQPIAEVSEIAHKHGALVHCDGVQAAGKIAVDFADLGVDFLSLSAHKIGGPCGVGALVKRAELDVEPLIRGGGQEKGLRGGTENIIGIAGFGAAAEAASRGLEGFLQLAVLRDRLQDTLVELGAEVFSGKAQRLANTLFATMPGVSSEAQVMAFDLDGIAVSAGSACSSGKAKASGTLAAMGVDNDIARTALRISMGWTTTQADLDQFVTAWKTLRDRTGNKSASAAA